MKLNIGCGPRKMAGYTNIDKFPVFEPDMLMDLEETPWAFAESSVDEIYASHVLEHIGATSDVFFAVVREMYRVLKPGGLLRVRVPHPRHDNFFSDPTHVRAFTPSSFSMFSKEKCRRQVEAGGNTFMLALALDVDFTPLRVDLVVEPKIVDKLNRGEMTTEQFNEMNAWSTNMFSEIVADLRCEK